jgi:hypothetical protein
LTHRSQKIDESDLAHRQRFQGIGIANDHPRVNRFMEMVFFACRPHNRVLDGTEEFDDVFFIETQDLFGEIVEVLLADGLGIELFPAPAKGHFAAAGEMDGNAMGFHLLKKEISVGRKTQTADLMVAFAVGDDLFLDRREIDLVVSVAVDDGVILGKGGRSEGESPTGFGDGFVIALVRLVAEDDEMSSFERPDVVVMKKPFDHPKPTQKSGEIVADL